MKTIDQTRAESLNFIVPPICQGQAVTYAYAVDGDRAALGYSDYIIRRRSEYGSPDIYERFIDPEHDKEGRNLDFWDLEPDLGDLTDEWEETGTKQSALKKLIDAGYDAELTANGIEVRGENWRVHYADRGQDFNEYHGDVPSEVEELAVWDDATTRTEKA